MKFWPAKWWPREAWWRDPDDPVRVVGWGPFPLPGERKASRRRGCEVRARRFVEDWHRLAAPERECRCWPGGGVPFDSYCEGNGCRP